MLNLYVGWHDKALKNVSGHFRNWFDNNNLMTDFSKNVVRCVDKSEVISPNLIQSPVLGAMPPSGLSGGCHAVLSLMYEDVIVDFAFFGENCYQFVVDISKVKDITLCTTIWIFPFKKTDLEGIHILNDGSYVYDDLQLYDKMHSLKGSRLW